MITSRNIQTSFRTVMVANCTFINVFRNKKDNFQEVCRLSNSKTNFRVLENFMYVLYILIPAPCMRCHQPKGALLKTQLAQTYAGFTPGVLKSICQLWKKDV